jgi:hypothetical protein
MTGMGRQRVQRGGRRVAPRTRPRYKRISAAGGAAAVTLVAVLGGMGVLPAGTGSGPTYAAGAAALAAAPGAVDANRLAGAGSPLAVEPRPQRTDDRSEPVLPDDSGEGRRIVFDTSEQRVWLVVERAGQDAVRRTYLVSGSVTDNLRPGSYAVYSRSRHAWGIEDSGTMQFMVRFAHGPHAAIGFHDIPVDGGRLVQTRAELGTPRSHGCIRQWRPDARALWRFAPVGTTVVVTA